MGDGVVGSANRGAAIVIEANNATAKTVFSRIILNKIMYKLKLRSKMVSLTLVMLY